MAKKKTPTETQARTKKAVAVSVERAKEREKIKLAEKPIAKQGKLTDLSKAELINEMGTCAYAVGKLQEQLGALQREHNVIQAKMQTLSRELDNRG